MASLVSLCRFVPTAGGTTDWTVSAAVQGYMTPAQAQAVSGAVYFYRAESGDQTQWELGYGALTGSVLARTTVLANSLGTQAKISFNIIPQVAIVAAADSFDPIDGAIFGLTLSTAGSSTTFTVGTGWAADSTAVGIMRLYASLAKTTSAWAVGAAGALDTGAIANSTWYATFLIKRLDTGVVDVLISLSGTAPTMPTNYTLFRRIGWLKTSAAGQWQSFIQDGENFLWTAQTASDLDTALPSTVLTLLSLTNVPPSNVIARLRGIYNTTSAAGADILITHPDDTISLDGNTAGRYRTASLSVSAISVAFNIDVRTNTSGQIRYQVSSAGGAALNITAYGWVDTRGRNN